MAVSLMVFGLDGVSLCDAVLVGVTVVALLGMNSLSAV